jgi:hypothetical protein
MGDAGVWAARDRSSRRKGPTCWLRACAAQLRAVPLPLVIAGSGEERDALAAMAPRLGLGGRVHFAGQSPTGSLYAMSDVFALASRREGLPLSLAEAGSFRLPALATEVGGVAEIVLDGETGLLAPSRDHAALGGALARLLADPALRARMGRAARARVEASFTVRRMARGVRADPRGAARRGPRSLLSPSVLRCYAPARGGPASRRAAGLMTGQSAMPRHGIHPARARAASRVELTRP